MSFVAPELAAPVEAFATALGIGLLVGMERERRPDSAAATRAASRSGCWIRPATSPVATPTRGSPDRSRRR